MKCTAKANANIALIKYWGRDKNNLPMNSSLSITLDRLSTYTTVEFCSKYKEDIIVINNDIVKGEKRERAVRQLDTIRKLSNTKLKAKIVSKNNFPMSAGLASSASGFAALTVAGCASLDLNLDKRQLSIIARQESGSACRSIYGGYVEWVKGDKNNPKNSFAIQLADENYFDISDTICVISEKEKQVSSRSGMEKTIKTCPLYKSKLEVSEQNLIQIKDAIKNKDFNKIGEIAEFDCLCMHAAMLTTKPSLIYWNSDTIKIIKLIQEWRTEGLEAYFTIDAGPNVHILSMPGQVNEIEKRLRELNFENIIKSGIGNDAYLLN